MQNTEGHTGVFVNDQIVSASEFAVKSSLSELSDLQSKKEKNEALARYLFGHVVEADLMAVSWQIAQLSQIEDLHAMTSRLTHNESNRQPEQTLPSGSSETYA
jgi:hypothetical protein